MNVGQFLSLPRPEWDWKTQDCCRWVDRWIVACGYTSPMEAIGIQYDSEMTALRRIAEGGGLAGLWAQGMAAVGIDDASDEPRPGDVGVIIRPTLCTMDKAMGLFTGERWATLGLRGLEVAPAVAVRIWRP